MNENKKQLKCNNVITKGLFRSNHNKRTKEDTQKV